MKSVMMKSVITRVLTASALLLVATAACAGRIDVAAPGGVGVVSVADDSQCSLREAMLVGNGAPANDDCATLADGSSTLTASLPASATFTLVDGPYAANGDNGLPDVTGSYVIDGHDATITRSTASGTPPFRLLHVATGGNLTVLHVTFSNGRLPGNVIGSSTVGDGGGLYNVGTLALDACTVSANRSAAADTGDGGSGGGIFSSGSLRIEDSTVVGNVAGGGANTSFFGAAGDGGSGGGVISSGTLTLIRSTISHNVAGAGGSGDNGPLGSGPDGRGGDGGGISASGPTTIKDSAIVDNAAGGGPGDGGDGGGLSLTAQATDTLAVVRTTIARNAVAAGSLGSGLYVGGGANLTVLASTVADNTASGAVAAGAIAVAANADVTLDYVTVSGNQGGGVLVNGDGEARYSVIGDQASGADCFGSDTPVSDHGNMDSDGSCNFHNDGDLVSGDPMLGGLAANGGLGQTMWPQSGSPLIDGVAPVNCDYNVSDAYEAHIDQRRRLRPSGAGCDVGAVEVTTRCYVDAAATPGGDGHSWATAYNDLQSALGAACGDIWVAQGVYTPSTSDVTARFNIVPGMHLYGGFPPGGGTLDQRDPHAWATILSGDLAGDDANSDQNQIDEHASDIANANSHHVIRIDGSDRKAAASTVLDGFIITGGDTGSAQSDNSGGGLYCDADSGFCSPHLAHLVFAGNRASNGVGGALFNAAGADGVSSPWLASVVFRGNAADSGGGGAMVNSAQGGGVSSPTLRNVTFVDNSAYVGGALSNVAAMGGASSPSLTNVTFAGNHAGNAGTAMISGADYGGDSRPRLVNVIIWGSDAAAKVVNTGGATPSFSHSVVQGSRDASGNWKSALGVDLGGNLDADPLLDPLQFNGGFVPTMLPGLSSPAVDAGDDHACPATDARGVPRPQNVACDIGAVESIPTASVRALGQNDQHALTGDRFAKPLVVQALNADGAPVIGAKFNVRGPTSGASATCTSEPTDNTGVARIFCVANAQVGSYSVYISTLATGLSSLGVDYTLTNTPNDRIFGSNFSGTPLPTATSVP